MFEDLSSLSHDRRVVRLFELGKASLRDEKAKAAIDELANGADAFERAMAVWTTFGSKDGGLVLRMLHDVSGRVRRLASRLVSIVCTDAQAFDALQVLWGTRKEKALLLALHARERHAAIDRGIDWLAQRPGIHDFADVVPLGSREAVTKHLARALARPSAIFWERLARNHADVLGDVLKERIVSAGVGESDPITRQLVTRHHYAIAERAPVKALEIAEMLAAREIESDARIWTKLPIAEVLTFFERHQKPVAHITISEERAQTLPADVLARAARMAITIKGRIEDLSEDRRRAIADAWASVARRHPRYGTRLLAWVSNAELRASAFEAWCAGARSVEGVISLHELSVIPADLSEQEGRRHIRDVVALRTRPAERLMYARFLPFDEAKAALEAYLGHPDGPVRGAAIGTLLAVVEHRPDDARAADEALEMVLARKYEQDPVRHNMFAALVAWKRTTWQQKHIAAIGQMLRDALDASDLSPGTAHTAESLLIRCFRLDPPWAATQLGIWLKERGQLAQPYLGAHLDADEIRAAGPVLLTIANTWTDQERFQMVIGLATSLAERMKLVDGFFEAIERARSRCPWGGWALQLTKLLRKHASDRYAAGLPALTRTWLDKGWWGELIALANDYDEGDTLDEDLAIALERIVTTSGNQYQVITAVDALRSRAHRRFGDRIERMIEKDASLVALPTVAAYLHRRRQDLLTPYLEGRRPVEGRFATGLTAWVLPFTKNFWRWTTVQNTRFAEQHVAVIQDVERDTPAILRAMSTLPEMCWAPMAGLTAFADDSRPVVKEKAIRVIARCDQGQGIPTLLRCLEDERARFAIYGLRRALKDLPPARALAILGNVALKKVTVAKEVLRLIGELRSDDAYVHLLKLDATPLHRDVRIALLRALWDHLEREETWSIFERAVSAPDWIMASRLGDIPADRLTATSDARLSKLLTKVVSRDEPEARIDLLQRAPYLAIRDPERTFLAACRARLLSIYDDEIRAAVMATLQRSDETDIPALKATLEQAHRTDERMTWVATDTILRFGTGRRVYVMAAAVVDALAATDPALTPLRVRSAKSLREHPHEDDAAPVATLLEEIAAQGRLSADVIFEARALIDTIAIERLKPLEQVLTGSAHAELRRLAVHALARDAAPGRGWTDERLARLAHHRRDRSDVVRAAANALFPPREITPPRETPAPKP